MKPLLTLMFLLCACTGTRRLNPESPAANACAECHDAAFASWRATGAHQEGCGACHVSDGAHQTDPDSGTIPSLAKLSRKDQVALCGKCHFDRAVAGRTARDPDARHGLFMSVGFRGYKDTLGCLECHGGHAGHASMLRRIKAHVCFTCHKEAVVFMGAYQPFNYLAGGHVCIGCHAAHGTSAVLQVTRMAAGAVLTCLVCHPTGNPERLWFSGEREEERD